MAGSVIGKGGANISRLRTEVSILIAWNVEPGIFNTSLATIECIQMKMQFRRAFQSPLVT